MKTRKQDDLADVLTVDDAAKRLGIGRNQAYKAAHAGEIPAIKIGKRFLVLRQPLERMLRGEVKAPATKTA